MTIFVSPGPKWSERIAPPLTPLGGGSFEPLRAAIVDRRIAVQRLGVIGKNLTGATPEEIRRRLDRAWIAALAMRSAKARSIAASIELKLADLPQAPADEFRGEIELLETTARLLNGETPTAWSDARPDSSGLGARLSRIGAWRDGDIGRFYALARAANAPPGGRHLQIAAVYERAVEAAVEAQQLRLAPARQLAEDAIALAPSGKLGGAAKLLPTVLLAELSYEQGHVDLAWSMLEDRLSLLREHGCLESANRAYPLLSRIAARRGDSASAVMLLRDGEQLGQQRGWPRLTATCLYARTEIFLAEGRLEEAQACRLGLDRLAGQRRFASGQLDPAAYATLAGARLALQADDGGGAEIVAAIRQMQRTAIARHDLQLGVYLSIRMIDALAAIGETEEALSLLCRLLELAVHTGLYQTLLDGGPRIAALLQVADAHISASGKLRHLASYSRSLAEHSAVTQQAASASRCSRGPLSQRECAILRLIGRGYSNKQIGKQLGIAFETVKSHAKNIYAKLGAGNRAEAVSKAERFGFI